MDEKLEDVVKKAKDFLIQNKLCVISTVSLTGKPESAVCIYMSNENFDFYFVTRQQTRKFENLKNNKNVAIVVGTVAAPETIQIEGEVELVSGKKNEFIETLVGRADLEELYYGPFLLTKGANFAIFKVKIKWLRYLHLNLKTFKEEYHQIIPS